MNPSRQVSRCRQQQSQARQRIASFCQSLKQISQWLGGREPLLKGSIYSRRRRCGKGGCRCARGRLHQDKVLAIRRGGRIQVCSLRLRKGTQELQAIKAWRQFQESRRELVATWNQLLRGVDRLGDLRQVHWN